MTWILLAAFAGILLGLYDYWTKIATLKTGVVEITVGSAFVGAILFLPSMLALAGPFSATPAHLLPALDHGAILAKSLMMTLSWLLAYAAVQAVPMTYSGAVRASGPVWTYLAALALFGERLTVVQVAAVLASVVAYWRLAVIGVREDRAILSWRPFLCMLAATWLSAFVTVWDRVLIDTLGIALVDIQTYSSAHRFLIAALVGLAMIGPRRTVRALSAGLPVALVGVAWVAAELLHLAAVGDPDANLTTISVLRRLSLVVGFLLAVYALKERYARDKAFVVAIVVASAAVLVAWR